MIPNLSRNPVSVLLVPPAGKMCHYTAQIDLFLFIFVSSKLACLHLRMSTNLSDVGKYLVLKC